jgi:endonuclease/exonuclease/phosphatase family metal-dependent hydrolase
VPRSPSSLLRLLGRVTAGLAALGWVGWVVGQVLTDRTAWSQWLHWIPGPLAIAIAVVLFVSVRLAGRRRPDPGVEAGPASPRLRTLTVRLLTWGVLLVTVARFAFDEHRLLNAPPPSPPGLAIMQWTIGEGSRAPYEDIARQIVAHDPHVAVMTDAPWVGVETAVVEWLAAHDGRRLRFGTTFNVLVRVPILEARAVAIREDVQFVRLVVAAPDMPDGRLAIAIINLPSDPWRARHAIADYVIGLLDTVDDRDRSDYDLVIGDFNMQRGSHSMRRIVEALMPGATPREAFDEGGHGYAATWSQQFPLWHIDHAWLGPDAACARYDTPFASAHRHFPQIAWITPRRPRPSTQD